MYFLLYFYFNYFIERKIILSNIVSSNLKGPIFSLSLFNFLFLFFFVCLRWVLFALKFYSSYEFLNWVNFKKKVKILSLNNYSQLSLSRSRRDPMKHFAISVLRHIRFAELRKIQIKQPNFTNKYVIWLLNLEIYIENIVEKGRNCSWGAISPHIHNILLPDVRFLRSKNEQIFSSR